MPEKDTKKPTDDKGLLYVLIYFFTWLTGIIFYIIEKDNKKVRFHALQAIFLGVIMMVLGFTIILSILDIFLWLYGLYIGYKESQGETVRVPYLADFADKYV
ncbi:MAG: hypothetical protein NT130_02110 [Candidatus Micrarchaeota archaeon]|nr:hypothetical protein [Candidatus Micrarchaeota archaeon]